MNDSTDTCEAGFIYVISYRGSGEFKIGMTRERTLERRIRTLQTTDGVEYKVKYAIHTQFPLRKERIIHSFLEEYRDHSMGKGWFRNITLDQIVFVIEEVNRFFAYVNPVYSYMRIERFA